MESDEELLARLRDGDEAAFVALVGRYQGSLLRVARTFVPSDAVAEEVVQDTWMGVVRGIDRFEGRSSFKTGSSASWSTGPAPRASASTAAFPSTPGSPR